MRESRCENNIAVSHNNQIYVVGVRFIVGFVKQKLEMRSSTPLSSLYMLYRYLAPRRLGTSSALVCLVRFSSDMYVLHDCLRYPEEVAGAEGVSFTSLLRDLGVKDEMSAR